MGSVILGSSSRNRYTQHALSATQARAICEQLLPIGDMIFDYMSSLRQTGFAAFVPYYDFLNSFCSSEREQELHRQCLIEGAKNRLARPWPLVMFAPYQEHLPFSPFLQRLIDERDQQNGVPETQLSSRYPGELWRQEVDPCERRKTYMEIVEKESYAISWKTMLSKQRECLRLEVDRHASGLSVDLSFDKRGRYALYAAVMTLAARPLGFHFDKQLSYSDYPVFSQEVAGDWVLCWTIDDEKVFLLSPMEGYFQPHLALRSKRVRGRLGKARVGEYFFIGYQHVVPGFGNAYWKFQDLNELETVIRAHLYLYSLMAPIITEGIRNAVEGFSKPMEQQ